MTQYDLFLSVSVNSPYKYPKTWHLPYILSLGVLKYSVSTLAHVKIYCMHSVFRLKIKLYIWCHSTVYFWSNYTIPTSPSWQLNVIFFYPC